MKLQVCSLFHLSRMKFVRWRTCVPREGKGSTAEEAIGSSRSEKTINILLCITCLPTTAEEGKRGRQKESSHFMTDKRSSVRAKTVKSEQSSSKLKNMSCTRRPVSVVASRAESLSGLRQRAAHAEEAGVMKSRLWRGAAVWEHSTPSAAV
ncbi:hypothetical protein Q8A67_021252 [Cirrhinus molitorella]|uniref:Uncharacterized protein n=1 Tax=Cirrhinus molitorella TaxID=172907 RepID=A0AA88P9F1_9TELE|nr:hypothetical protein Q8A67_021252 [Cirrhinus molitorella]